MLSCTQTLTRNKPTVLRLCDSYSVWKDSETPRLNLRQNCKTLLESHRWTRVDVWSEVSSLHFTASRHGSVKFRCAAFEATDVICLHRGVRGSSVERVLPCVLLGHWTRWTLQAVQIHHLSHVLVERSALDLVFRDWYFRNGSNAAETNFVILTGNILSWQCVTGVMNQPWGSLRCVCACVCVTSYITFVCVPSLLLLFAKIVWGRLLSQVLWKPIIAKKNMSKHPCLLFSMKAHKLAASWWVNAPEKLLPYYYRCLNANSIMFCEHALTWLSDAARVLHLSFSNWL